MHLILVGIIVFAVFPRLAAIALAAGALILIKLLS